MGLTGDEVVGVILTMTSTMFYKSMTTHNDHSLWQDVYHAPCPKEERGQDSKLTSRKQAEFYLHFSVLRGASRDNHRHLFFNPLPTITTK